MVEQLTVNIKRSLRWKLRSELFGITVKAKFYCHSRESGNPVGHANTVGTPSFCWGRRRD